MFSNLTALLIIFILGAICKKLKLFSERDVSKFLMFVFYISAPSLILHTFPTFKFEKSYFILPIIGASISIVMFLTIKVLLSLYKRKNKELNKKTEGTAYTATMIANTSLAIAVSLSLFGKEGMVKAQMIDFGNAILIFSFVFFVSAMFGSGERKTALKQLLKSPPIWAIMISLIMNYLSITFPTWFDETFRTLSLTFIPLIVFSLGAYINLKLNKKLALSLIVVFTKIFLGLVFGLLIAKAFNFGRVSTLIILLAFSAPCGYNTLIFSSINKLDESFASNVVSLSIIIYIILIPVLMHIL